MIRLYAWLNADFDRARTWWFLVGAIFGLAVASVLGIIR